MMNLILSLALPLGVLFVIMLCAVMAVLIETRRGGD